MIRFFDVLFSLIGIVFLLPILIVISVLIKLTSSGPVFYKQQRVGINNNDFNVFKFRTMAVDSDKKGLLTVGGKDSRITKVGYYLRKSKLDELPQLINVFFGEMSLVGPRPEVRKYVNLYDDNQKKILAIRPGISDWASIIYRDENVILEKSQNPELDYVKKIMPDKIRFNFIYLNNYGISEYFKIIYFTVVKIIFSSYNVEKYL
ncbi:sugar transferase [Flavobacterium maritimum]|uniref:sugar transferase n=1 Tax=Flavobacterium maritimum TaxID=3149042 RepID=UPI0032B3D890